MNFSIRHIVFISLFFSCNVSFSQEKEEETGKCPEIDNRDAVKLYEKGIDKKKYKKEERMLFLKQAMEMEPDYTEANFIYAQERVQTLVYEGGTFVSTEPYFLKIIEVCPKRHSDPYYYLGFSYYEQEKYEDAIKYLDKFVKFSDEDDKKFAKDYDVKLARAKEMIKYAKVYIEIIKMKNNPVPFDPKPVQNICTQKDEYLPIITPDNEMALFTRRMPFMSKSGISGMTTDKLIEVFSFSKRGNNGLFDQGESMPTPPFNKNTNEGGATVSIDNKHLFYTICKDEGGTQLNCDIYFSDLVNGEWTEVKKIEGVNDPVSWDSQPSIAADGKTLYFGSDRKSGLGGVDIYKTVRDATDKWSVPVNMGPKINTSGNDKSPFMHSDSETLYFSSDGHPGFGGFDIFYVKKDEKGEWLQPKNIGYPINTEGDDLGFFASTDGKYGYFATNNSSKVKGKSVGGYDIYSFELYKEARPDAVAFIKGILKNEAGEVLTGASMEIKSSISKEKTDVVHDTTTGEYAAIVNIKKKEDFIITVKKDGFAFNSKMVSAVESEYKPTNDGIRAKLAKVDFEVKLTEVGKTYTLNDVNYDVSSADLKKESKIVIEEFVSYLKENPTIKIEIHGHTDNAGDDNSNMALSNDRAFTVNAMLQENGIPKSRILNVQGFGKTKPIASNDTEEGRAKNRRTEFVIVEK